jgi:hypothetical protein
MTRDKELIMAHLRVYLEAHPTIRFGQALFNLDINQFASNDPKDQDYTLRDIHSDSDDMIVKRIERAT